MASGDWAQQQKMLSAAGLLVMGLEAKEKIEQLVDINPLIEAANSSNVQFLTVKSIDELLSLVSIDESITCLLYTSPSPRDRTRSRMPSSA